MGSQRPLVERYDELKGTVSLLHERVAELENYLDVVAAERNAADNIASKMATAIGWDTPGENWVEKAAALRDVKEQLAEARRDLSLALAEILAKHSDCVPRAEYEGESDAAYVRGFEACYPFAEEQAMATARAGMSHLQAQLAEAIDLLRHPNGHDIESFLSRVTTFGPPEEYRHDR